MGTSNKTTQSLENIKALSSLYSADFQSFNNDIINAKNNLEKIIKKLNEKEALILAEKKQAEELLLQQEAIKETAPQPKTTEEVAANVKTELPAAEVAENIVVKEKIDKEPAGAASLPKSKPQPQQTQAQTQPQQSQPLDRQPQQAPSRQYINNQPDYSRRPPQQNTQPYQSRPQQGSYGQNRPQQGPYGQNRPSGQQQGPGGYAPRPGYTPGGYNSQRPPYNSSRPAPLNTKPASGEPIAPVKNKVYIEKKKPTDKNYDDKRNVGKKALVKKGLIGDFAPNDEEKMGSKKYKTKRFKEIVVPEKIKIEKAFVTAEIIPLKTLSEKFGITATEISKRLFKNDIIKTINESIDYETAALIALDLGIELELRLDKTAEEALSAFHIAEDDKDVKMIKRPPVVTVLGHVDHGKTSLLDAIRKTSVVTGEAGGITQHIGAYTVKINNQAITFIDTPGHEAFTAMRARGAQVTDVAVLVVAADDGVMPQTVEALKHAKDANVPIVVALNKIDKPGADTERIKQQLSEHSVLPEEWGGDSIMVPVSAKSGIGIEKLLEAIILTADVLDLKANPNRKAKGTIIEAKLDKGKGPIATVLVQNGTLKIGDTIISGTSMGKIRAMLDDKGNSVKEAGPSYAVAVLGFSDVPNAGDMIYAAEGEKMSRQVLSERISLIKESKVKTSSKLSLDDAFSKITDETLKNFNLIIKGDVQGSVEAIKESLLKLSNEEVKVNIIHGGVGAINESDIMLAKAANAQIIGFNIRCDTKTKQLASQSNVEVKLYKIIYEAIDALTLVIKGMLTPKYKEVSLGTAEVRNVFKITGSGVIAGCYITNGKITRNAGARVKRGGKQIFEGKLSSLKRFKDDVKEVAAGYECGISIENFSDLKELDIIEAFTLELIPR